ncbi:MAG: UDP-3-O-(3-hydroxymyristoyl)glucosamine N-acyltransferase, partial [Bacteroidota bacterium]
KIYPHAYIGDNVCLGDNVTIFSGVKIYHGTKIGKNCIIHAGAVIGSDGFGFAPDDEGVFKKIEQVGIVHIKDDVEIGANTTIDRATMGETLIESGVKLDNLIQVAHNVVIGKNTVMAAQTGISGTAKIGSQCMFGGQVGISGHVDIGDKVSIAAQSGVPGDVKSGETIMGSPAISARDYKRNFVIQKQIPEMRDEIQQLKREIARLKDK